MSHSISDRSQQVVRKSQRFKFFDRVPGLRDTNDPEYAGVLLVYLCIVAAILILLGKRANGYTHVLQTAGGLLVLLGLYITGISTRTARLEQYASRVLGAIAQLDSTNEAVKIGTVRMLEAMLHETPNVTTEDRLKVQRYKTAIIDTLEALGNSGNMPSAKLALRIVAGPVAVDIRKKTEIDPHQT